MAPYRLRFAQAKDAAAIRSIYQPYVLNTPVTFEYETPSADEMKNRMLQIQTAYPYLICLNEKGVAGYAYAARHRERAAYQWNAELSVYIGKDHQRGGLGRKMYTALMDILALQNVRNVYGCVTLPNPGSEKLHLSMGFSQCGVYPKTGYKCGKWHDVAWFEKSIAPHDRDPEPFIPLPAIAQNAVCGILDGVF